MQVPLLAIAAVWALAALISQVCRMGVQLRRPALASSKATAKAFRADPYAAATTFSLSGAADYRLRSHRMLEMRLSEITLGAPLMRYRPLSSPAFIPLTAK
jgi:hypothetical protein